MHSSRMSTARMLPHGGGFPDRDPWTESQSGVKTSLRAVLTLNSMH